MASKLGVTALYVTHTQESGGSFDPRIAATGSRPRSHGHNSLNHTNLVINHCYEGSKNIQIYSPPTHTNLMALFPGLPRWAGARKKVKPIWILLKQETVSGSGISWAICKSAPRFRQITTPAPNHSVFYRPDALPAAQPTTSKHWRLIKIDSHSC